MAAINTTVSLAGMFKEVYGPDIKDLVTNTLKVTRRIPFTEATMVGNLYHQPVDLSQEHGVPKGHFSRNFFCYFTHEAAPPLFGILSFEAKRVEDENGIKVGESEEPRLKLAQRKSEAGNSADL